MLITGHVYFPQDVFKTETKEESPMEICFFS